MIRTIRPSGGVWIAWGHKGPHGPLDLGSNARKRARQAHAVRLRALRRRRRFELDAIRYALALVKAGRVPRPVPPLAGGNRRKRRAVMQALRVMVNS